MTSEILRASCYSLSQHGCYILLLWASLCVLKHLTLHKCQFNYRTLVLNTDGLSQYSITGLLEMKVLTRFTWIRFQSYTQRTKIKHSSSSPHLQSAKTWRISIPSGTRAPAHCEHITSSRGMRNVTLMLILQAKDDSLSREVT